MQNGGTEGAPRGDGPSLNYKKTVPKKVGLNFVTRHRTVSGAVFSGFISYGCVQQCCTPTSTVYQRDFVSTVLLTILR
jgi:hypothetical protein